MDYIGAVDIDSLVDKVLDPIKTKVTESVGSTIDSATSAVTDAQQTVADAKQAISDARNAATEAKNAVVGYGATTVILQTIIAGGVLVAAYQLWKMNQKRR
jgi:hypothetical protein